MTLRDLTSKVTNYKAGGRLPSFKKLEASNADIILHVNIGSKKLKVYDNGLISFSNMVGTIERHTVYNIFHLELRYEFNKYDAKPINLNAYPEIQDMEATDLLIMCGQDRLDYNTSNREQSRIKGTLDNSGDDYAPKSNTRRKPVNYPDFTDSIIDHLEPENKINYISKLNSAMSHLSEKQFAVIHLYYYELYTQQQIADKLGIDRSSVKSRLDGALKKLRKYMK